MQFLEATKLAKTYGRGEDEVRALRGIDFAVEAGEFVVVMGESGSGKSTLLHLLGALDSPSAGEVRVGGRSLAGLSSRERTRYRRETTGFVFQQYNLVSTLTAVENVELPLFYAGVPRRERRTRALAALESVGLAGRVKHLPHQMSGGEQQRAAIARAVVHRPALLLADEPTGNVDTHTTEALLDLMLRFRKEAGLTIVLVTHNPWIGERAGKLVRLRDGEVVG